jgi:hypothetical protein
VLRRNPADSAVCTKHYGQNDISSEIFTGAFVKKIILIFVVGLIVGCSTIPNQLDKYGNPIFNSITIDENEYEGFGVSANYYTISNNIENPNSSFFVTKLPTDEQIFDFATNNPSYFWIIHNEKEIFKMISLNQSFNNWNDVKWSFFVIDLANGTSKEFPLSFWKLHVTEHRMLEMKHGIEMMDQDLLDKEDRIFDHFVGQKIHGIVPYSKVYEKLLTFINDNKLYLHETDIQNINYVDKNETKN